MIILVCAQVRRKFVGFWSRAFNVCILILVGDINTELQRYSRTDIEPKVCSARSAPEELVSNQISTVRRSEIH
jgi:hypothetical protein